MKWFRVKRYADDIIPIEVVRETEKQVVLLVENFNHTKREIHSAKVSEYEQYFSTWIEAKEFLISRLARQITFHQNTADLKIMALSTVHALEEPK